VLAQDSPTGMVWSLSDRLGSIDLLTDASGNVVDKRTYDSFGNLLEQTNPFIAFRYGYTAREIDAESGLYFYRARYYDPSIGRFISVDPMSFEAGDTNLYRYVFNSPTQWTDPSGEIVPLLLAGALAMGALNAMIDVNVQLAVNNMTGQTDMNWASVGVSFVTGVLGFGLAQKATQVGSLAWKIAANPLVQRGVDSAIDGGGKIIENSINGKDWNNGLTETVIGSFVLGTAADAGIKGAGKAWSKHGDSVINSAKNLDRWGGSVLDWSKNPLRQLQTSYAGGLPGGGSKWGLNALDSNADSLSQQFMAMSMGLNRAARSNLEASKEAFVEKFRNISSRSDNKIAIRNNKGEVVDYQIPAVAQNRINIRKGRNDLSNSYKGSGLDYAWKGHSDPAKINKSHFTITKEELIDVLRDPAVISSPVTIANKGSSAGDYVLKREVDLGRVIGESISKTSSGGISKKPTSFVTILTDGFGNLKNVFPGKLDVN
jgi:RHS repeat-associated protein